jgi:acetyltransferase-like isoleucine patch superfamily enzyme
MRRFFRRFGAFLQWIFPERLALKCNQVLNYIRSGYRLRGIAGGDSVFLEGPVQFVGKESISFLGDAILKSGCRIEAWRTYNGEHFNPKIAIGKNTRMGINCHVTAIQAVIIGDDVLFGSNVLVSDNDHGEFENDFRILPVQRKLHSKGPVQIGDRCWLGDNVAVLSGVTIGEGCIIGANSVVTSDIPSFSVAVGSPARVVKSIQ